MRAYVLVAVGFIIGTFVGGFVVNTDPAIGGWLFGAGSGLTGGAFLAAITSNVQLVGGGPAPLPWPDLPERSLNGGGTGNGAGAHEQPLGALERDEPE